MNNPDSRIEHMLRESPPEPRPRPGLETRICSTLRQSPRTAPNPVLSVTVGLALATPMFIFGMLVLFSQPAEQTEATTSLAPPPAGIDQVPPSLTERNPLRDEALAIRQDASRAGRFLLDALPSLAER